MRIIYESSFMILTYQSSLKLMEIVWLPTRNSMLPAQFQSEFLTFLLYQDQYKCERLLLDERHLKFKATPSIQKWIKEIINKRANYYSKKIVILVSEELLRRQFLEDTVTGLNLEKTQINLFSSKGAAKNFLLDNNIRNTSYETIISSLLLS
ncbi:hypothetical protein [Chondrinema litorale]|uniref:hypothetical protein n=1 Tax=Chondrinema litorale TaxID=2994555 RepID=UPI002543F36F|nr:hypothetical protein [Chondrinema litorale]UZR99599.1 hypothetical protein OQ292_37050 [Chondrinema litorale]